MQTAKNYIFSLAFNVYRVILCMFILLTYGMNLGSLCNRHPRNVL